MPRSRSAGRSAPARAPTRPTVASNGPSPQQQRPNATMAAQPRGAAAPAGTQGQQGPGLFGQMASTAAGVAVGSSIGHAIGGFFGGGSSEAAMPQDNSLQAAGQQQQQQQQYSAGNNCGGAAEQLTRCLDEQSGNMQVCGWYLEQLKACQAAARQY